MCDVDGTGEVSIDVEDPLDIKEEGSIKVEEAIDIKDEIQEAKIFPPINTEHEVRLWGVCKVVFVCGGGVCEAVFVCGGGVCEVVFCVWWWWYVRWWQLMLLGHLFAPKRKL
jgi:hypothetical protein